MDAGAKTAMLTDERLSTLFDAAVRVDERHGYFHARV
jgi:hypothetical protein